ncbi:hypothetical protein [Pelagerythrobacter rhizovicinus]|uniref:Uncharacterized protein n=1 Tax=Pelagerythrobacter rhizovicinus TaxID=2268576 RepID=A0A4Q2KGX6_9SPHN|nr:hypothetical protein [Pelagerythrobacter rhizovicinus]RXZ64345.1 hypothetical protein ETX26_10610 [Pelagerythrobacter rhizovicinus]
MSRGTIVAAGILLALQTGLFALLATGWLGDYDSSTLALIVYFLAGTWFFAVGAALIVSASLLRWLINRPNDRR